MEVLCCSKGHNVEVTAVEAVIFAPGMYLAFWHSVIGELACAPDTWLVCALSAAHEFVNGHEEEIFGQALALKDFQVEKEIDELEVLLREDSNLLH